MIAAPVDDDDLAGVHFPHQPRADGVERAGFGRKEVAALPHAQHQRPDAPGIAHAIELSGGHHHQRIGAAHLFHHALDAAFDGIAPGFPGDDVQKHLRIHFGLKEMSVGHQFAAQLGAVDEVAIMGKGDAAAMAVHDEGLGVDDRMGAGTGGVAHVADDDVFPGKLRELRAVGKHLAQQAHALVINDLFTVRGRQARAVLPAVLHGVERQIGLPCRVHRAAVERAEHAAFFVQLPIQAGGRFAPAAARAGRVLTHGAPPPSDGGTPLHRLPPRRRDPGGSGPCPAFRSFPCPKGGRCPGKSRRPE